MYTFDWLFTFVWASHFVCCILCEKAAIFNCIVFCMIWLRITHTGGDQIETVYEISRYTWSFHTLKSFQVCSDMIATRTDNTNSQLELHTVLTSTLPAQNSSELITLLTTRSLFGSYHSPCHPVFIITVLTSALAAQNSSELRTPLTTRSLYSWNISGLSWSNLEKIILDVKNHSK